MRLAKIPIPQNNAGMMQFDTEKGLDETEEIYMQASAVKDMFHGDIVRKSIQILRSHGKSDKEIKEMMSQDFSISEAALDELLNAKKN